VKIIEKEWTNNIEEQGI